MLHGKGFILPLLIISTANELFRNAPFILGVREAALAVAAGNTMILKGAELAPKGYWAIGDMFRQAGLPPGCVNILFHRTSDAAEVTEALIAAPEIQKVCFIGSTAIGRIVATTASKYLKPVMLELGGKGSCIVLEDANLEKAAHACTLGAFLHVRPPRHFRHVSRFTDLSQHDRLGKSACPLSASLFIVV